MHTRLHVGLPKHISYSNLDTHLYSRHKPGDRGVNFWYSHRIIICLSLTLFRHIIHVYCIGIHLLMVHTNFIATSVLLLIVFLSSSVIVRSLYFKSSISLVNRVSLRDTKERSE